jgi:hypothetical protein
MDYCGTLISLGYLDCRVRILIYYWRNAKSLESPEFQPVMIQGGYHHNLDIQDSVEGVEDFLVCCFCNTIQSSFQGVAVM